MENEMIKWVAIHRKILVVASIRADGWKAYVLPVPGCNHEKEAEELWRDEGTQLPEYQARVFFPNFNETQYAK
jgi:hypothetical protein